MANRPRICLISQRNLKQSISLSGTYEKEDVICEIDDVDLLALEPCRKLKSIQIAQKIMRKLVRNRYFSPEFKKVTLNRNYDVFLISCQSGSDLRALNAVKKWKERCKISVCWLEEIWVSQLQRQKQYLNILSKFDYIILNCNGSIEKVQDMIRRPCYYLPPGIDTIRFCPYPNLSPRYVDVFSIGRRSHTIHSSLLKMAEKKQIFYIHDTTQNMITKNHKQHRDLLANISKRSRYFLVNPAKFNVFEENNGQNEIGLRYFEGAASGSIMIGEKPKLDSFRKNFSWPDSVIQVPRETENIGEILADLNSQPDRLKEIRKNNVIQSLLHHDWSYRWKKILDIIGLEPRQSLFNREKRLKKLSEMVENNPE